ncbi:MAG: MmgE/PrpD family protein [Thermodesulfobacteriota bacterium]|nr:MmgE/PrpD family protein [Thermodesulfobacteriota bacterium]
MDLIKTLITNVVDSGFNDLPHDVITITKMGILDAIGALIAGANAQGCKEIVDIVKEWGGKEESTVMIYGGKIPAHNAALANAVMARALEIDDAIDKGMHMSSSLVPVGFAIGEKAGGISGKDFLTAIALGTDIAARISKATLDYHGFDPTLACGIFGTTACASKLLGLDKVKMENAMGLAFNESSGSFQSNIDGTLSVRLNQGLAACEGIMSAIFADRGITGVKNVLNGPFGYFHLFSNDQKNLHYLEEDLGKKFYGIYTIFKRWPSCGGTLPAVDATLELKEQYNITPDDIEHITVRISEFCYSVCKDFKPEENPAVDAQFSHRYVIANVLLRGRPKIEHFTDEYIKDKEIRKLIDKIEPEEDITRDCNTRLLETDVEMKLKDGRLLTKKLNVMKGHPENPVTEDEIVAKFRDTLYFAKSKGIGWNKDPEKIIDAVKNIEDIDDIREIVSLLTF